MRFTYTYRSSDGQRHTAEIEAESRDAAFAKVRSELGVKPIKVVAAEPDAADGGMGTTMHDGALRRAPLQGAARILRLASIVLLAFVLVVGAWLLLRRGAASGPVTVMTPQGLVTYTVAEPLPRQTIPGDRRRIDGGRTSAFESAAERWLARFAEPGRDAENAGMRNHGNGESNPVPTESEFRNCLREPIRISSADFTEAVDLKRIVAGMKREMRAYLAGGGTVGQYLSELARRQKLEISYRERAEQKLAEMLSAARRNSPADPGAEKPEKQKALKSAYAYWLKANAQLQAMGIFPIALPDSLRAYQMTLDIEE